MILKLFTKKDSLFQVEIGINNIQHFFREKFLSGKKCQFHCSWKLVALALTFLTIILSSVIAYFGGKFIYFEINSTFWSLKAKSLQKSLRTAPSLVGCRETISSFCQTFFSINDKLIRINLTSRSCLFGKLFYCSEAIQD